MKKEADTRKNTACDYHNTITRFAQGFFKLLVLTATVLFGCLLFPERVSADTGGVRAMYRLFNPYNGEHFYTANAGERDHLDRIGWNYEGVGWYAPVSSGQPVYRLFNRFVGDHHYTLNAGERDWLVSLGWNYEGIGWYSSDTGQVPVYRQFNPFAKTGSHNFTTNKGENDYLATIGWNAEGIAWYGVNPTADQKAAADAAGGSSGNSASGIRPLHVDGTRLVNDKGEQVVLKGLSTHGIAWFPQYVNRDAFHTLKTGWNANVVRLAMYTQEYGGYCSGGNQTKLKNLIDQGVQAATAENMYVIIDWHILSDGNPLPHQSEAISFFREMSQRYAGHSNVLYEICNEPNSSDWNSQIKPYADSVIPVIRANAPNAVIIVGTNQWCQKPMDVVNNRLSYDNIMYSVHFYAGTHGQWLRDETTRALNAGIPVFISECSITDASGNGGVNTTEGQAWMNFIRQNGLSYVEWSLCNKGESASVIKSSCSQTSGWTDSDLTSVGLWFKNQMQ